MSFARKRLACIPLEEFCNKVGSAPARQPSPRLGRNLAASSARLAAMRASNCAPRSLSFFCLANFGERCQSATTNLTRPTRPPIWAQICSSVNSNTPPLADCLGCSLLATQLACRLACQLSPLLVHHRPRRRKSLGSLARRGSGGGEIKRGASSSESYSLSFFIQSHFRSAGAPMFRRRLLGRKLSERASKRTGPSPNENEQFNAIQAEFN